MPRKKTVKFYPIFLLSALGLILFCACSPEPPSPLAKTGCNICHKVTIDPAHDIGCTKCHKGDEKAKTLKAAHKGLIPRPAHPDHMAEACGGCHPKEVARAAASRHFTLKDEIGGVWGAFFPDEPAPSVKDLPIEEPPRTEKGIVANALRRRCLLCHVYYEGDDYSGVRRGTGCAACHLPIKAGTCIKGRIDHRFNLAVKDKNCLACHYGNFVGWDYYGRFEKDYEEGYRAPLVKGRHIPRPYGIEWHEMTPDIHKKYGMTCTDCHAKGPCQRKNGGQERPSCLGCHDTKAGAGEARQMDPQTPGHRDSDLGRVSCEACHAVWGFYDEGRSLVLQDNPIFDDWTYLSVQGSSEVEDVVSRYLAGALRGPVVMLDKINGKTRPGMWFQVFYERRWWPVMLGEDKNGRLRVMRPLLDISISYLNAQGNAVFDNLKPKTPPLVPYTPHTTGAADTFRTIAVKQWLENTAAGHNGQGLQ